MEEKTVDALLIASRIVRISEVRIFMAVVGYNVMLNRKYGGMMYRQRQVDIARRRYMQLVTHPLSVCIDLKPRYVWAIMAYHQKESLSARHL